MATDSRERMSESSNKKGSCRLSEEVEPSSNSFPVSAGKRSLSPSSNNKFPKDEDGTEDVKKQKLSFGVGSKTNLLQSKPFSIGPKKGGIQIKFGAQKQVSSGPTVMKNAASIFNQDDDEETEEMPPEAKMRMRNIGRDTPTSAGPNSFGKTKQGFCDSKKVFEKSLKNAMEKASQD